MVEKIGSFLLCCILVSLFGIAVAATGQNNITLSVIDQFGKKTHEITAGMPFKLRVDFTDGGPQYYDRATLNHYGTCTILDKTVVTHVTSSGARKKEKKQYIFLLRCDEMGSISLGPVVFEGKRDSVSSDMITIQVKPPDYRIDETGPVFLRARSLKESVYVGEKVPVEVSFYSRSDSARDFSVTPFEPTDVLKPVGLTGPTVSKVKLDKGLYSVLTWQMDVAASKPGKFVVPSMKGTYSEVVGGWIFSVFTERHYTYSNAVPLTVKPLPKVAGDLHGVGSFSSYTATVDRTRVEAGKAVVLTLALTGNTDFSALDSVPLSLPEGIKYFKSSKNITRTHDQETKFFEYVLQPKEAGTYTIDAQKFFYFDPQSERYTSISTRPVTIEVAPASVQKAKQEEAAAPREEKEKLPSTVFAALPASPSSKPMLPGWMMVALFILSLVVGFYRELAIGYKKFVLDTIAYRRAFAFARSAVKKAERAQRPQDLYPIFMELFSRRAIGIKMVSPQALESLLVKKNIAIPMLKKWQEYLVKLQSNHYTQQHDTDVLIFHEARAWINELEKYL